MEGKSQRCISQELGVSRKTVKKYILCYEKNLSQIGDNHVALLKSLSTPTSYEVHGRSKKKLTVEVIKRIDELLSQNAVKRTSGLSKQVLKKIDIHHQLLAEGFTIGYTSVCGYIKSKARSSNKEVFIRQHYSPGSSCEFDWGEVKLVINGTLVKYQLAIFTATYSNYRYAALYRKQDTLSFLESHVDFMNHCGGSYGQMIYDNMRVAVAKFVGKEEKVPTRALLDLRAHYQFTHRFCTIYKGNEKGHVERSVEYIRRKSFGFTHHFSSEQQANDYLQEVVDRLNHTEQKLTGKTAYALFAEEKAHLRPFPSPMACSQMEEFRVDKYSTISFRTNRYSVPEKLVGEFVAVKIYSDKLEVFHHNDRQTCHTRSYEKHQWIIDIHHYLETFKVKPGALANSVALVSNHYLKTLYDQHFEQQPRAFIDLLRYCYSRQIEQEQLSLPVKKLLANSPNRSVNIEALMALLGNEAPTTGIASSESSSAINTFSKHHLQKVAHLLSN